MDCYSEIDFKLFELISLRIIILVYSHNKGLQFAQSVIWIIVLVHISFSFFFFNRRILLHGKNSQKRDNIKKKDNKTTNNLTYIHK